MSDKKFSKTLAIRQIMNVSLCHSNKEMETVKEMQKYTVTQYAAKIGKTRQRVLQMIEGKDLPEGVKAEKLGHNWIIYAP